MHETGKCGISERISINLKPVSHFEESCEYQQVKFINVLLDILKLVERNFGL